MGNKRKGLQRSLGIYLSKIKSVPFHLHIPNSPRTAASASTNWLLSACKYPKTPSFAADRDRPNVHAGDPAASLSDIDRFLQDKFQSLHIRDDPAGGGLCQSPGRYNDEDELRRPSEFRLSECFFVSPGTSGSLRDDAALGGAASPSTSSPSSSSYSSNKAEPEVPGGGVAMMTFSKDPYDDFRRSMQEMMDARHVGKRQALDWDFMEELLSCYLELNDRSVHKYILRAFTDLTVSFRRQGRRRRPDSTKQRMSKRLESERERKSISGAVGEGEGMNSGC